MYILSQLGQPFQNFGLSNLHLLKLKFESYHQRINTFDKLEVVKKIKLATQTQTHPTTYIDDEPHHRIQTINLNES